MSVLLLWRDEILCDGNPKKCPHLDEHVPFPDINYEVVLHSTAIKKLACELSSTLSLNMNKDK